MLYVTVKSKPSIEFKRMWNKAKNHKAMDVLETHIIVIGNLMETLYMIQAPRPLYMQLIHQCVK